MLLLDTGTKNLSAEAAFIESTAWAAYRNGQRDDFLAAATAASTYNAENLLLNEFENYSASRICARNYALFFLLLALIGFAALFDEIVSAIFLIISCLIVAPITLFRFFSIFVPAKPSAKYNDSEALIAPVYTLLIAVYREASVIDSLVQSLEKLNWPKDRLDVIFVCESDDQLTIQKINSLSTKLNYRLLCLSDGPIKTKPRALQAGLSFAKGRYIAVYDAEDDPHPNQLREAYEMFAKSDEKLGVVQAPLIAWNERESWISGQFALDYAVWFGIILPALETLSNYLPLGGTSNHFRTSALREVGGWDPYNVTEDADLGARLCRFGYYARTISSPTYEEAPPKISGWIRQRSRWMHGHLQTMAVHFKDINLCSKQMGMRQFAAFSLSITSGPLNVALRLPIAIFCLYGVLFLDLPLAQFVILGILVCSEILVNLVAIVRDKRANLFVALFSLPLYWLLQILAFVRALFNVLKRPFYWEKTDHGLDARNI